MMGSLFLALCLWMQTPAPAISVDPSTQAPQAQAQQSQAQRPSPEEVQRWWQGLSEREQLDYRERLQRYRELQPTMREELERRHQLLRAERRRIVENLSAAERAEFDKLKRDERRRFVDQRAETNLRRRGERLEREFPGLGPPRPQEDWTERHRRMSRAFEKRRAPQVRAAIVKAASTGWIGPTAAKWLETAPIHEAMAALGEVHKWQFLQQAHEQGLWEEIGFDEKRRRELTAMPALEFFQAVRGIREGMGDWPGRQGKFGIHGERNAEGRGGGGRGPGGSRFGPQRDFKRGPQRGGAEQPLPSPPPRLEDPQGIPREDK